MKKEKLVPVFGADSRGRHADRWYRFSRPDMLSFGTDGQAQYADFLSACSSEPFHLRVRLLLQRIPPLVRISIRRAGTSIEWRA
jgi:hypothetical protein